MTALSLAVLILLVGAGACLIPMRSAAQAGVSLLSQSLAMGVLGLPIFTVLSGGAPVVSDMAWAYPMGVLRTRLDPLGAFFLAWSLPMTLLGSVYAVGYMRAHFDSRRHLGIHFALLNLTSLAFVLVYTADHALVFLLGW
ncbi:MAG: proton-conducting membrane transporter, partial [Burkholderiaceae bacterium]|nr:proton-conducting membrane transporter [Burkholderiaceae bacterium]